MRQHASEVQLASSVVARLALAARTGVLGEVLQPIRHLAPMWRLLFPALMLLVLSLAHLGVRVAHAQASSELRTNVARARDAGTARERLRLELSVRAGHTHLREAATVYGLVQPSSTVVVQAGGQP